MPETTTKLATSDKLAVSNNGQSGQLTANGYRFATMEDAWKFATHAARSGMVPKAYEANPAAVLVAIQMGSEVGLGAMTSLRGIAVINGRPSFFGPVAKALVLDSGLCEEFEEWYEIDGKAVKHPSAEHLKNDNFRAVCRTKRKGHRESEETSFSIGDAKTAKLWEKRGHNGQDTPWITAPLRMLKHRARGFNLQDNFPDVLQGIYSSIEEAQDISGVYDQEPEAVGGNAVRPPTGEFDASFEEKPAEAAKPEEVKPLAPPADNGQASQMGPAPTPETNEPVQEAPKRGRKAKQPEENPEDPVWMQELDQQGGKIIELIVLAKSSDDLQDPRGRYAKIMARMSELNVRNEKYVVEASNDIARAWFKKRIDVCASKDELFTIAPMINSDKVVESCGKELVAELNAYYAAKEHALKHPKSAEAKSDDFLGS